MLRDILMVAFFTSVGMGASLRLFGSRRPASGDLFGLATIGAVFQNGLGIGLAKVFGLNPLLGIVSGSVALTGGPATALSFGKTSRALGVTARLPFGSLRDVRHVAGGL